MFEIVRDDQNTVILFGMFLISTGEFSELWKKQQYDIQRCMRLLNSMGCSGYQLVNFQNFGSSTVCFQRFHHIERWRVLNSKPSRSQKNLLFQFFRFSSNEIISKKTFQMRQKWFSLLLGFISGKKLPWNHRMGRKTKAS